MFIYLLIICSYYNYFCFGINYNNNSNDETYDYCDSKKTEPTLINLPTSTLTNLLTLGRSIINALSYINNTNVNTDANMNNQPRLIIDLKLQYQITQASDAILESISDDEFDELENEVASITVLTFLFRSIKYFLNQRFLMPNLASNECSISRELLQIETTFINNLLFIQQLLKSYLTNRRLFQILNTIFQIPVEFHSRSSILHVYPHSEFHYMG